MNIEEIRKNAPDGAIYWAKLYESVEYLRCENKMWHWWNGFSWLSCSEKTAKSLNLVVL